MSRSQGHPRASWWKQPLAKDLCMQYLLTFLTPFYDTPCYLWSRPTLGGTYLGRQSATLGLFVVCLGAQLFAYCCSVGLRALIRCSAFWHRQLMFFLFFPPSPPRAIFINMGGVKPSPSLCMPLFCRVSVRDLRAQTLLELIELRTRLRFYRKKSKQ